MERENFNSRTQGQRNARTTEDVSELRNGPSTTRLHQKKLITPSCDIRFSSFLGWIEARECRVLNRKRKFQFYNSGPEKRPKKWRCVWTEERTVHDQASPEKAHSSLVRYPIFEFFRLDRSARAQGFQWEEEISNPELRARETPKKWRCVWTEEQTDHDQASPEKAHNSLGRYPIFEFFRLNRSARAEGFQWKEKIWILELRARETPEKVKMCLNWGTDRARPGFTRKSS
jgi:hypothetical protein